MSRTLDQLPEAVECVRAIWRGPDAVSLTDAELIAATIGTTPY